LCALQINIAQSFRRFVEAQISIENRITRIKYARYANRIPSLTALAGELFLGHYRLKPRPPAVDAFRLCRCSVNNVCKRN
jgi:hypothetical protein